VKVIILLDGARHDIEAEDAQTAIRDILVDANLTEDQVKIRSYQDTIIYIEMK